MRTEAELVTEYLTESQLNTDISAYPEEREKIVS
jgi:hypothetical protein